MTDYSLSVHALYSQISNHELDEMVRAIQMQFSTCGNRQMEGHLLSRGVRVQQERVHEAQRQVDPAGYLLRRLRTINHQQYHVDGPSALWHIDENHKLIR